MNENRCVCCGEIIPEGWQVCSRCTCVSMNEISGVLHALEICEGQPENCGLRGECPYGDRGCADCERVMHEHAARLLRENKKR